MSETRYHLTVTVEEPNPDYEAQLSERRRRMSNYGYESGPMTDEPRPYRTMNTLDVNLNAEQWEAVKRAVLETFK